tara:strand:- start:1665 stop:3458 length:1794 start_codon:yes stop_codon:yes gene_type:complete
MNNLTQYLFEVILGSSVLFLGYYLTKNFLSIAFRRYFLLGCLLLPLIFPLLSIGTPEKVIGEIPNQVNHFFDTSYKENLAENVSLIVPTVQMESEAQSLDHQNSKSEISWKNLGVFIYFMVVAFLLIRMSFSLFSLLKLIRNPKAEFNGTRFFIVDQQQFSGGSFFHFIFINKKYLNDPVIEIILAHEQVHSRLWHSVDILLSELYCIVFWVNPVAWFLRNEVRLNTEYQADQLTSKGFDRQHYSDTLLNLSIHSQNLQPVISFSAINIRSRIRYILEGKRHHWSRSLLTIPFLIIATWLISCEPEMMDFSTMDPQAALKNVKTVTTRYISHQKDTQQKDGKIIAIAYYLPDGTVDRVEQHTSYPYDHDKPFTWSLIATPNPVGVLHILDGLGMGEAAYNILYGHDWPRYKDIDDFGMKGERINRITTTKKNDLGLPRSYLIEEELNQDIFYQGEERYSKGMVMNRHEETFDYSDGRVISHSRYTYYPAREILMKKIQPKNIDYQPPSKQLIHETNFSYDGDNLIKVTNNVPQNGSLATTQMNYENGIITSASYFREDKRYNHREFYYDESGLKTRTEIFNVYGEPEYTIIYDYEYY